METKNEQNIIEIFNSFVNTITTDKDVLSSLVLIKTKDDILMYVEGEDISIAESVIELCKKIPRVEYVLKFALFVLEK